MNVYLDTSALVKLYVEEEGSARAKNVVAGADLVGTSLIAYLEALAAFARRQREGDLTADDYGAVVRAFAGEWERFYAAEVSMPLVKAASLLAEKNALRAMDALHLASAKALAESTGIPWTFLAADQRLIRAAVIEGLEAIDVAH